MFLFYRETVPLWRALLELPLPVLGIYSASMGRHGRGRRGGHRHKTHHHKMHHHIAAHHKHKTHNTHRAHHRSRFGHRTAGRRHFGVHHGGTTSTWHIPAATPTRVTLVSSTTNLGLLSDQLPLYALGLLSDQVRLPPHPSTAAALTLRLERVNVVSLPCLQEFKAFVRRINDRIEQARAEIQRSMYLLIFCCFGFCSLASKANTVSRQYVHDVQDMLTEANKSVEASGRALRYRFDTSHGVNQSYFYVRFASLRAWSGALWSALRNDMYLALYGRTRLRSLRKKRRSRSSIVQRSLQRPLSLLACQSQRLYLWRHLELQQRYH